MRGVEGKVALVTGGGGGIGLEIASDLAARGARIVVCDLAYPAAAVARLEGEGARVLGVEGDVSDAEAVGRAVQAAVAAFGGVDLLVNNAGLFTTISRAPFDRLPLEEWRRVLDVNVTGVFLFSRAVWPHMRAAGGGRIVNISSATAYSAPPMMLHYVASKGALTAMTKAMAREMGADGITVNAAAPGFTLSSGVLEQRSQGLQAAAERSREARAIKRRATSSARSPSCAATTAPSSPARLSSSTAARSCPDGGRLAPGLGVSPAPAAGRLSSTRFRRRSEPDPRLDTPTSAGPPRQAHSSEPSFL